MKMEQGLYLRFKALPKDKKKVANKIIKQIKKLEGRIRMKKKSTEFDKRYNPKGVFSESCLKMDDMKIRVFDLKEELNKILMEQTSGELAGTALTGQEKNG